MEKRQARENARDRRQTAVHGIRFIVCVEKVPFAIITGPVNLSDTRISSKPLLHMYITCSTITVYMYGLSIKITA